MKKQYWNKWKGQTMSRIIQLPGKPIFKIVITVDDKGEVVYETETHTPLGPVIKNQMHPAVLAKIFASCGAVAAEHCLQMFSKGKVELEGVKKNETEAKAD